MNAHAFRRSTLFWLGIALLLSLVAAWLRSSFYRDEASIVFVCVENGIGQVNVIFNPDSRGWSTYFTSNATYPRRIWFPSAVSFSKGPFGSGAVISFSHWFLIVLTTLAWLALLSSERRRLRLQRVETTTAAIRLPSSRLRKSRKSSLPSRSSGRMWGRRSNAMVRGGIWTAETRHRFPHRGLPRRITLWVRPSPVLHAGKPTAEKR